MSVLPRRKMPASSHTAERHRQKESGCVLTQESAWLRDFAMPVEVHLGPYNYKAAKKKRKEELLASLEESALCPTAEADGLPHGHLPGEARVDDAGEWELHESFNLAITSAPSPT